MTETRPGHSGQKDNSSPCLCFSASDSTTPVTGVSPPAERARRFVGTSLSFGTQRQSMLAKK